MPKRTTSISVNDISISVSSFQNEDYICITDMAKARTGEARAADVIKNWIRNRSTLEFLGTWEILYNPNFKVVEFDHFKTQAGLPTFTLSTKQWREANPELAKKNNIRDFATINELTVLSNLETHNAELIKSGQSKQERFKTLSQIAGYQIAVLDEAEKMKTTKNYLSQNRF